MTKRLKTKIQITIRGLFRAQWPLGAIYKRSRTGLKTEGDDTRDGKHTVISL